MTTRLAVFFRRLACSSAGLLSVPLGLFTFFLFCATGQPVPSGFVPASRLPFEVPSMGASDLDPNGRQTLLAMSSGRRCMMTAEQVRTAPEHGLFDRTNVTLRILDSVSMQTLYEVPVFDGGVLPYELAPDRKNLIAMHNDMLQVLNPGPAQTSFQKIQGPWDDPRERESWQGVGFEFAPDCRHLLICSHEWALDYSLKDCKTLADFRIPATWTSLACFYDSHGRAKCLNFFEPNGQAGRIEVRDLESKQVDVILDQSEFQKQGIREDDLTCASSRISPKRTLIVTRLDGQNLLLFRSLEDGRSISSYPISGNQSWLGDFSPDDRFLLLGIVNRHPLVHLLEGWHQDLDEWLKNSFPTRSQYALVDVQTGVTWLGLVGDREYAFSDDGTRLISYTNQGRYEYDLPPQRWQLPPSYTLGSGPSWRPGGYTP